MVIRRELTLAAIFVVLLSGCATQYQERSSIGAAFFGGVSIEKVGGDTYRVFAQGNAYTSPLQVETFVLRRAAKQAREGGYEGFRVVGGNNLTSTQFGAVSVAKVQPGLVTSTTIPFATAYPAVEILVKLTNENSPTDGFFKAADYPN